MEEKYKKLLPVKLKDLKFQELDGFPEYTNTLLIEEDVNLKEYAKTEIAPYGGENPEELVDFIDNETPEDEYLRVNRDGKRELMQIREELNTLAESIKSVIDGIDSAFNRIDMAYKKQVYGSSEEDDLY
ncbi:hypothetical protein [Methanomethylovorans sp.]|uniref:hypothetical protein n=1 Tax=Methanomethylovorans sp. TaxID=2758717 RepID=UPI00351C63FA